MKYQVECQMLNQRKWYTPPTWNLCDDHAEAAKWIADDRVFRRRLGLRPIKYRVVEVETGGAIIAEFTMRIGSKP